MATSPRPTGPLSPRRRAVLGMLAASPVLAACGGDPLSSASSSDGGSGASGGEGAVTVGSANFAESEILGELYAQVLEAKGLQVNRTMQIGSREVYLGALEDGSIDLIAEYTGNLLGFYDKKAEATEPDAVLSALQEALPEHLEVLTPAEAEDKDSYTVTGAFAEEHGIRSLADLSGFEGSLRVGGLPELAQRDYGAGLAGLEEVYGVPADKLEFTAISDGGGPLTVRALADGDVDVANIFSTSPAIEENGFVALEDPEGMITAQNVVPLLRKEKVSARIRAALDPVQEALTTEDLMAMNAAHAGEQKRQPQQVAADWLREKGLV